MFNLVSWCIPLQLVPSDPAFLGGSSHPSGSEKDANTPLMQHMACHLMKNEIIRLFQINSHFMAKLWKYWPVIVERLTFLDGGLGDNLLDPDSKIVFGHHHFATSNEFLIHIHIHIGIGGLIELHD